MASFRRSSFKNELARLETRPHIAVVIPCYGVAKQISDVVSRLPSVIDTIILADDHSLDDTALVLDRLAALDQRIVVIRHSQNQGVGGATKSGYQEALRRNADLVVKIDGDGQMDPAYMEALMLPILIGQAEYSKGNRFYDWSYVQTMPLARKIGNLGLSFLTKLASGYWNVFDPTNGYTAISAETLKELDFAHLEQRYLFETSMLVELYRLGARIRQIPMPAVYMGAPSALSVSKSFFEFSTYLARATVKRFMHRYVWQDFTAVSLFVLLGTDYA